MKYPRTQIPDEKGRDARVVRDLQRWHRLRPIQNFIRHRVLDPVIPVLQILI